MWKIVHVKILYLGIYIKDNFAHDVLKIYQIRTWTIFYATKIKINFRHNVSYPIYFVSKEPSVRCFYEYINDI